MYTIVSNHSINAWTSEVTSFEVYTRIGRHVLSTVIHTKHRLK